MKKFITLAITAISTLGLLNSCVYDRGSDTTIVNNVVLPIHEVKADFSVNDKHLFNINPVMHSTDKLLVYRLWGKTDNNRDIWRMVPNSVYFNNGEILSYNYDFTVADINLFIEANFNVDTFSNFDKEKYLRNQYFRIVELPAGTASKAPIDYNDYDQVIEFYGLKDAPVIKNY
ncbi:hypothetical protein AB4865_08630 [Capnocytophaga sp. ARDL2]|uniref:hypothetical protein n=1 Tax=Capnocytophaga sp. ARDL2 TaxID=3238809 RepID=UPI0035573ACB